MGVTVTALTPLFAAQVDGVDVGQPVDDAAWAQVRAAFEDRSVLVFRGQPLDDDAQIAFSQRFGPLQLAGTANPGRGSYFSRQSNLDITTGLVIPPDDRRMVYQRGNMLWHSDSSFRTVPALCSLLSGRIVPPEGGATEFASTRAAYEALPEAMRRRIGRLTVVHDFAWSRDQVGSGILTEAERADTPPVEHPIIRVNPAHGRRALFIGAHASHIVGMSIEEGRALLRELLEFATQPRFCYRHQWREGDLVVWDNRCVLHRATPYDSVRHRRLMQRTTVAGSPEARAGANVFLGKETS